MTEQVDRRGFFRLAGRIGHHVVLGGSVLSATEAFAVRGIQSIHEITPEVVNRLDESAKQMAPYIKFLPVDDSENAIDEAKRFNSKPMAQAIAQLAYYEGGYSEVARVASFVSVKRVEISFSDSDQINEIGSKIEGRFRQSKGLDDPAKVILYPPISLTIAQQNVGVIRGNRGEDLLLHELQHLVQQARDPENYNAYLSVCSIATPAILNVTSSGIINEILPEKFSRRSLLRNTLLSCVLVAPVLTATRVLEDQGMVISSLHEREAYSRAKLIDTPGFKNVRGQLLSSFVSEEDIKRSPEKKFAKEFVEALLTTDFTKVEPFFSPDYPQNEYTEDFYTVLGKNIQGWNINRILPVIKSDAIFWLNWKEPTADKYLRVELQPMLNGQYTSYGIIFLGLQRINDRYYIKELVVS